MFLEELKGTVKPNLIFTHNRNDAHQDHRTTDLTWSNFWTT
jgi:LmbE family N-acetylglucosaminyl deacetylase